ncbi:hypothetical protein F5Y16DRAFT_221324 [Xylariaceae sp. FL0255]|nr:hypothetical protein F5Y16DRAFT_221324 [Xylariaceae sp. FL0255]
MSSDAPLVYYPQYCFHLSPTINKWCPLRVADIVGLECRPGFEDVDVFFSLNHPIRWIRILGVVVAVDDYYGRRVYTIDDSTGQCIECTLATPKSKVSDRQDICDAQNDATARSSKAASSAVVSATKDMNTSNTTAAPPPPPSNIDVGAVLEVKGSIKLFRGQKQIHILKMVHILSTTQEVLFWDKIRDFRRDVLSHPWVLKEKEVRKCKKLYQTEVAGRSKAEKKEKEKKVRHEKAKAADEAGGSNLEEIARKERTHRRAANSLSTVSATVMRAERAARAEKLREMAGDENQYGALGL